MYYFQFGEFQWSIFRIKLSICRVEFVVWKVCVQHRRILVVSADSLSWLVAFTL